ncbi:MAG: hypothetical protein Q9187_004696 [Circinaria calcarea]
MSSRLGSEAEEDPMEISSELGQKIATGEDIDIDLDLVDDRSENEDDEYMIEDMEPLVDLDGSGDNELRSSNDDEMADDAHTPLMVEDVTFSNDEDLVDAEEDNLDLNTSADVITTTANPGQVQTEDSDLYQQTPVAQVTKDVKDYAGDYTQSNLVTAGEGTVFHHPQILEPETNDDGSKELSLPSPTSADPNDDVAHTITDEASYSKDSDNLNNNLLGAPGNLLLGVQTPLEPSDSKRIESNHDLFLQPSTLVHILQGAQDDDADNHQPVAKTPPHTDNAPYDDTQLNHTSHVHSVIVVYQQSQISLFPPMEQNSDQAETYFLSDASLAGKSILELLKACRIVLAESINEEDELEIKLESLNLDFCECTAESSTTSLSQILELYLQLQLNDGVDDPDPLFLTLTTRVKLANRLEYLYAAVAGGKGFADVAHFQASSTSEDGEDGNEISEVPDYEDDIGIDGGEASQAFGVTAGLSSAEFDEEDDKYPQSTGNKLGSNEKLPTSSGITTDDGRTESGQTQSNMSNDKENEVAGGDDTRDDLSASYSTDPQTTDKSEKDQNSKDGQGEANKAEASYHETEEDGDNSGGSDGLLDGNVTSSRISNEISLSNEDFDNTHANTANFAQPTAHAEVGKLGDGDEDSIDYEEDERIHGSSAATSTVHGDDSEVPIGSDGKVLSEFHNHPTILNDEEGKPRSGSTDHQAATFNVGVNDGNNLSDLSNGEHEHIHDFEDDKADPKNEDPIKSDNIEQSPTSRGQHTSGLPSKGNSAFDDDEITYDDDEEEEDQNESGTDQTLLHTDNFLHESAEIPGSNSPSLKRLRTDPDGGDTSEDGLQGRTS